MAKYLQSLVAFAVAGQHSLAAKFDAVSIYAHDPSQGRPPRLRQGRAFIRGHNQGGNRGFFILRLDFLQRPHIRLRLEIRREKGVQLALSHSLLELLQEVLSQAAKCGCLHRACGVKELGLEFLRDARTHRRTPAAFHLGPPPTDKPAASGTAATCRQSSADPCE